MASSGYANLTAPIVGGSILKWADGTVHVYVAQNKRIKEASGSGTWTDRSAGAADYTAMANCQFAAYGSVTLAASLTNTLQASTGGAFAAVATAPKAQCIAVMSNTVVLGNYNNGSAVPDGWFASATGDYTNWTAAANNAVASGRLLDTPGPINAMATLNDQVIAWKSRGMYLGRSVPAPVYWSWQLLSADVGCVGPDAWVHTDAGIVFASERDVFLYDGGAVRSIAGGVVRNALYSGITSFSETRLTYEPAQSLVYVFVKRGSSGTAGSDTGFAWNHQSNKWGQLGTTATGGFGNSSYTYVQAVVRNPNYLDMTSKAFSTNSYGNSAMVVSSEGSPVVFAGDLPYTDSNNAEIITGPLGQTGQLSSITRILPSYFVAPQSAETMSVSFGMDTISTVDGTDTATWDQTHTRFDYRKTALYFSLQHVIAGEVNGYRILYTPGPLE
jgi:hypothetical protein